jgi:hypothetical protein
MAKLVRIVAKQSNGMFGFKIDDEVVSILPLIGESKTTITFRTPNGNLFSANIVKKETNTVFFDSYYVDSIVQLGDDK